MTEQFLGFLGTFVSFQVLGTRHEQMPIGQQSYGNERRIMQLFINPKCEIDSFGYLIHDAFGDEHLNPDVGVNCLESHDDRRQEGI